MTTVAEVVERCRNDYFLTGNREERNKLSSDVDASTTTWPLTYDLKGVQEGAKLSCGLEDVYVWEVTSSPAAATVDRGEFGSTPATHTSGDNVYVNSKITDAQVVRAINDELGTLSGEGLFQMKAVNVTYNTSVLGYDLTDATALDIWDVREDTPGVEADWPRVRGWTSEQKMPTTGAHSVASGISVMVPSGYAGRSVRIFYRAPFTAALDSLVDDVETVSGINSEAISLLAVGAAVRLATGREVKRAFAEHQGSTRRAEEVPPGSANQGVRGLLAERERLLVAERRRLIQKYPPTVWNR